MKTVSVAVLVALLALTATVAAHADGTLSNPEWNITLSDGGYSDAMFSPQGHEQLSGEWAAAIRYDGIANGESMWLEPTWTCPDWTSNSQFSVIEPFATWDDPTNPVSGNDTGHSRIANGELEIAIDAVMLDGKTVMGLSPAVASPNRVTSYRYVMRQTYAIKNVTAAPLQNAAFFQMMHPHPNDDYEPNNYGTYDPTPYADAGDNFTGYHYDMTFLAPYANWQADLDDVVGFSSIVAPTAYQVGTFRSDGCGGGEPGPGSLHRLVQADALSGVSYAGPEEIAGAMKWFLGAINPGEAVSVSVVFSTSHSDLGLPPEPVPQTAVIAYTGDTSGCEGAQVTLSATLADQNGSQIVGRAVGFLLGQQAASATTNDAGVAMTSLVLSHAPGTYMVTASFLGDAQYGGALSSAYFDILSCPDPGCPTLTVGTREAYAGSRVYVPVEFDPGAYSVGAMNFTAEYACEDATLLPPPPPVCKPGPVTEAVDAELTCVVDEPAAIGECSVTAAIINAPVVPVPAIENGDVADPLFRVLLAAGPSVPVCIPRSSVAFGSTEGPDVCVGPTTCGNIIVVGSGVCTQGDCNCDGAVNGGDRVCLITKFFNPSLQGTCPCEDCNLSGHTNAADAPCITLCAFGQCPIIDN
jgi:hypothetical protein